MFNIPQINITIEKSLECDELIIKKLKTFFCKLCLNKLPRIKVELDTINIHIHNTFKALGYYRRLDKTINLRYDLMKYNIELYIDEIVGHEFAHYVVHLKHGSEPVRSHGKEFRKVCKELEVKSKSTTSAFNDYYDKYVPTKTRTYKRFLYKCTCGKESIISPQLHNKFKRGANTYICQHCFTNISIKNFIKETYVTK